MPVYESASFDLVQLGQIGTEHDALASDHIDPACDE